MNNQNELMHYGVLGMKWGRRKASRYDKRADYINSKIQVKKDNSKILTIRDGTKISRAARLKSRAEDLRNDKKITIRQSNRKARIAEKTAIKEAKQYNKNIRKNKANEQWSTKKKVAVGGAATASILSVYGGYKLSQNDFERLKLKRSAAMGVEFARIGTNSLLNTVKRRW